MFDNSRLSCGATVFNDFILCPSSYSYNLRGDGGREREIIETSRAEPAWQLQKNDIAAPTPRRTLCVKSLTEIF